jgi:hypothetical protein
LDHETVVVSIVGAYSHGRRGARTVAPSFGVVLKQASRVRGLSAIDARNVERKGGGYSQ